MMTETAAPLAPEARAALRYARLAGLHAQLARVGLQIRQETAALVEDDTPFALRAFVADELSMVLAESPATCRRLVDEARLTMAFPRLLAHAAASIDAAVTAAASGRPEVVGDLFGPRHVDAVLDELAGTPAHLVDPVLDLVLGDESARTPHQLRQATRAARMLLDLDADEQRQNRLHEQRSVTVLEESRGGASLFVGGTKTRAAEMLACIDAHVAVADPGDDRTLAQRRYDFVYGLLCGRIQVTAPWQALIVVSLDTLESGDTPAEIPGLGLVTADEAREACAQADLRRAVVNTRGELVGLDNQLMPGDQTPLGPAPVDLTSHAPEPELLDDPEPAASLEEWAWLAQHDPSDDPTEEFLRAQDDLREARILTLCHDGLARLEQHLARHAAFELVHRVLTPRGITVRPITGPINTDPDDPEPPPGGSRGPTRPGPVRPGGDGRGTPRPTPPTPDHSNTPPSRADTDWLHQHEDANGVHDHLTSKTPARTQAWAPSYQKLQWRTERLERQARASRWTRDGLHTAVSQYRTRTPDPLPGRSRGYPFRGRLARWIKIRDLGCVFPGCPLLAQRCQLDHLLEHPRGKTEHSNGACECTHHHQAKHACMTLTRQPDGTLHWTNRHGLTRTRPVRPLLRGW